ncbi:type IX secretion system PorP/SprF family membrane protein [Mucilaginibacter gracilis]|uniref:Type IX secretion system PorP/SprF family membrane protein n=2 Tax=Mucilaginibacter gracilis TaxID=423350 RepID=A0A495IZY8_9SPHI|nr:type IX secretion system PorP/SprF family membrane protein [Mucilaginibacter gracilis]
MKAYKIMRSQNIKALHLVIGVLCMLGATQGAKAQLTGFHSGYFQNEYLTNPAMAGMEKGLNLNLGYQQQWNTVPGGPKLQNATADFGAGNNVGLGINLNADQAGLLSRTRVMGTFAYHLPISGDGDKLNFGLSLGITSNHLDYSKIVGDASDIQAANYNNRGAYVDGDFGLSYTNKALTLQGSLPNLKSIFSQADGEDLEIDRATFFTAASYKITFDNPYNKLIVEPKVAYRGVKGFDNIFDGGVDLLMPTNHFDISTVYHTNKTITFGAGLDLPTMGLLFAYTNNTGAVSAYAPNTFELGIKFKLFK